jgi:exodeoxyribonuclease VII large subunit
MTPNDRSTLPFDDPEPAPTPPERRLLTVSELTATVRSLLESRLGDVWVEGELSNCRLWNTGHLYFSLKDPSAQIRAVMFRSAVRRLRFAPEDGLHVVARGRVSVYEPKGEYQLVCEHMEPHGLGARQLAFEQLKRRLQGEGLFDAARKRALPLVPRKIGVVTSLDGAALRDIVRVLRRRYPNAHLIVRPTRVQGDGAADEVARGLAAIGRVAGVDVVIVGRGGGSIEDLWAFNEEVVARAIAASPVPVISAVGHEIDFTIADFVADLRAATPSAAAELVVARKDEYAGGVVRTIERLRAAARQAIGRRRAAVHALETRRGLAAWPARLAMRSRRAAELGHALGAAAAAALARRDRRLREVRRRLDAVDPGRRLGAVRLRLTGAVSRLDAAADKGRARADGRLRVLAGRLDTLSPLAVLGRGYAVCWNADRTRVIRAATAVAPGDLVRVTLNQGEIACEVKRTG